VESSRDQLFSGTRFAEDQHARLSRSDQFDLRKNRLQSRTFAEQAAEILVYFGPEVVVFLFHLLVQRMDLLEGSGIRDGYGSLIGE
jgi:hypothetical protein